MPSIGTGSGGAPVVGIPSGDPPGSLVQRVVIDGGGSSVVPGQTIVMQYLAMNWETGDVVASTWTDGRPSEIAVDELAEGVRLAVLDRSVGSRVLAVVPPGLADGEHTLVVVVDILAATGGDDPVR
jgi:peptidylprolyl isomerase